MVDLVGTLSNPDLCKSWEKLAKVLAEVRTANEPVRHAKRVSKVRRRGQVLNIICTLLERVNKPMQAKEIHRAVEQELGEPVAWSSVINCLCRHSRGEGAKFERIGRGKYSLVLS